MKKQGNTTVKCPKCGSEMYDYDAYCGKCGARLSPSRRRPGGTPGRNLLYVMVTVLALSAVGKGTSMILQKISKSSTHYLATYLSQRDGNKWGYIDEMGNVQIDAVYDWVEDFDPTFGVAAVAVRGYEDTMQYGLVNTKGEEVIPCQYNAIESLDAYGWMQLWKTDGEEEYCGVGSAEGDIFISNEYGYVTNIADSGLFIAENVDGKYGVLDHNWNWVIQPTYDRIYAIENEDRDMEQVNEKYVLVASLNERHGIINTDEEVLVPFRYNGIDDFSQNGQIRVTDTDRWYYGRITLDGEEVMPCQYERLDPYNSEGLTVACRDGEYCILNSDGAIQGYITEADDVYQMNHSYAIATKDGYYGIVNSDGSWVIEPKYWQTDLSENYIEVYYEDDSATLFDINGNFLNDSYEGYRLDDDTKVVLGWEESSNSYEAVDETGETFVDGYYNDYWVNEGWINLYNDSSYQSGILINPDGEIVGRDYVRYFTDDDTEYITAWDENDTDEWDEEIAVASSLLDKDGTFIRKFNDDRYSVGKFVKVR